MGTPVLSLSQLRIASPCGVDWDSMTGDEQSRHCGQCNLRVHNLSAMTEREALAFLSAEDGRSCVRFYKRADGTVITRDCPVGLSGARRRLQRIAAAVAALLGLAGWVVGRSDENRDLKLARLQPFAWVRERVLGTPPPPAPPVLMGAIAMPPPPPPRAIMGKRPSFK